MQLTAVYFTLLVSVLGAAHGYSCGSNLIIGIGQCLANITIDFSLSTDLSEMLRRAQFIDFETHCRKIDSYMDALECAIEYVKQCVEADFAAFFPDPTKMRQGLKLLCQHLDDIKAKCLQNRRETIERCDIDIMKDVTEKYQKENRHLSTTELVCTSYDIAYDCAAVYLQGCLGSTKAIYLEQLDKYMVPSACPSPSRSRIPYIKSGAASITILFQPFSAVLVSMATLIFLRWSG